MVGNNHDSRPRQDRQYREGLMTGLLIALANPLVFTELGMSKLRFLFREVAEIS